MFSSSLLPSTVVATSPLAILDMTGPSALNENLGKRDYSPFNTTFEFAAYVCFTGPL